MLLIAGLTVVWFPAHLILFAMRYLAAPDGLMTLRLLAGMVGFGTSLFTIWVLTHKDTKQWVASKHPDKFIAGLDD